MRRAILLALVLSASAATAAEPAPRPSPAALAAITVADLEKEMLGAEGAQLWVALKANYPAEYPLLLEELLRRIKASDGSFAAAHLIGAQVMRDFMTRHSSGLINAPPELLRQINLKQLELLRGLARDQVALCAEYATTGFTGRTPLPEPHFSRAEELSVIFIQASKAGTERPLEASRGTLAPEDARAWVDAVRKIGTSQDVIDAMNQAPESSMPSPDTSCRMGVAVYAAIDTLPVEQAGRVAAYVFSEGMKAQSAR